MKKVFLICLASLIAHPTPTETTKKEDELSKLEALLRVLNSKGTIT